MAARKKAPSKPAGSDVDDFMRALEHPLKAEIEAVRAIIRGASPEISEGIKWNAPSFRCGEWFATVHLRSRDAVQVILHLGAKVRGDGAKGVLVEDPEGLLEWLGKDRASVKLRDMSEIRAKGGAFGEIVRGWVAHLR